jgi:hypothetical protein
LLPLAPLKWDKKREALNKKFSLFVISLLLSAQADESNEQSEEEEQFQFKSKLLYLSLALNYRHHFYCTHLFKLASGTMCLLVYHDFATINFECFHVLQRLDKFLLQLCSSCAPLPSLL